MLFAADTSCSESVENDNVLNWPVTEATTPHARPPPATHTPMPAIATPTRHVQVVKQVQWKASSYRCCWRRSHSAAERRMTSALSQRAPQSRRGRHHLTGQSTRRHTTTASEQKGAVHTYKPTVPELDDAVTPSTDTCTPSTTLVPPLAPL